MIDFNKITRYLFYTLAFILPFAVIPSSLVSSVFSKKLILAFLAFLILIFAALEAIKYKKIKYRKSRFTAAMFLFLSVSFLSLDFYQVFSQGFFGAPNQADSIFTTIIYFLIFFIAANLLTKDKLPKVIDMLLAGSGVFAFLFLAQHLSGGEGILAFSFMDSAYSISLFFGSALVLLISKVILGCFKRFKFDNLYFLILGILFLLPVIIIDFKLTWFLIFISSLLILWMALNRGFFCKEKEKVLIIISILIFSAVLFFIPLSYHYVQPMDAAPFGISLNVIENTLSESLKNLTIGSGPSTFSFQYLLYKGVEAAPYGTAVFDQAALGIMTLLATTGIVGLLAILIIVLLFFAQGIYYIIKGMDLSTKKEIDECDIRGVVFPAGFYLFLTLFFYKLSFVLIALMFLMLGLWVASRNKLLEINLAKLKTNKAFGLMAASCLVLVFSAMGVANLASQYRAETSYQKAVLLYNEQGKTDESIEMMEKAISINKRDNYYLDLSKLYLIKASKVYLQSSDSDIANNTQAQEMISSAVSNAEFARSLNPMNFYNWYNLGFIYEELIFYIDDAENYALQAYQQAKNLSPYNVNTYLRIAEVYQLEQETSLALQEYRDALEIDPENEDIILLIEDLMENSVEEE